jgi:hypothetical protein
VLNSKDNHENTKTRKPEGSRLLFLLRSEMSSLRWTAERMDQLENAARRGLRVALSRRGTEYIVVALRMASDDQHEAFVGWLPMTGEELTFRLNDIESFQVIE